MQLKDLVFLLFFVERLRCPLKVQKRVGPNVLSESMEVRGRFSHSNKLLSKVAGGQVGNPLRDSSNYVN